MRVQVPPPAPRFALIQVSFARCPKLRSFVKTIGIEEHFLSPAVRTACDLQRKMTGFLRRYLTFAFARRRRPRKRSFTQRLVGRRGWHYFADGYGVLQESSAPRADETRNLGYFAIPQAWFSTGDAKPVRDLMRDLERGESRRTLSDPFSPFESKLV